CARDGDIITKGVYFDYW
nr:immunoglobulin heavy chain junction region [Mus musculus]